jgi:hypothetical protein
VSPGANGQIDIGVLTNRGYLDVTWNFGGAGYRLDTASITDLAPEFTLGGAGLGTVKLDAGQAPVLLTPMTNSSTSVTYRYWTTGNYAAAAGTDDVVDITFIDGSWSFTETGSPAPAQASVTLTSAQWLTVNFDAVVPAGFTLDAASILDLAAEFTLSYSGQNAAKSGSGTIALVGTVAPQRIGDGNTYRYRVSGDFAVDGTQSVTLVYAPQAWSFTSARRPLPRTRRRTPAHWPPPATATSTSRSHPRCRPTRPARPTRSRPCRSPTDITLSGAGILGPPDPSGRHGSGRRHAAGQWRVPLLRERQPVPGRRQRPGHGAGGCRQRHRLQPRRQRPTARPARPSRCRARPAASPARPMAAWSAWPR